MSHRPICCTCLIEMVPKKNGFIVETMDNLAKEGFQKLAGDQYECPECLQKIVIGIAATPITVRATCCPCHPHPPYGSVRADLQYWATANDRAKFWEFWGKLLPPKETAA